MDRRRILALPVFPHPAGHHVPVATLRQQPEVKKQEVEWLLTAVLCLLLSPVSLLCPRYAFSPLLDEESEDEEKEPMVNEAFGG